MTTASDKSCPDLKIASTAAVAAVLFGIVYWYQRPIPSPDDGDSTQGQTNLLDLYLPEAEFAGQVSVTIHAPASAIYAAMRAVTLNDMPVAAWLGKLRYLPSQLLGKTMPPQELNAVPFLEYLQTEGGNLLLAQKMDHEYVIGAIGKFHDPLDQHFVHLDGPNEFLRFDDPEYQKLAMSFRIVPLGDGERHRLVLTHRTHALSNAARWKFALYWLGIKPGGNFVSWQMLRAIKSLAEKATISVA